MHIQPTSPTPRPNLSRPPLPAATEEPRDGCALTAQESQLLEALPRPTRATPFVMLMDTGFDVDDETALLVGAALHKRGIISLESIVTTTDPSDMRARLTKGALNELGLGAVPVAVGDSALPEGFSRQEQRLQAPYLAASEAVESNAAARLRESLTKAEDHSVVLLVIAKMTDVNRLLNSDEALFRQKVKQVVLMGGVRQGSEQSDTTVEQLETSSGYLIANTQATNNRHDQAAANQFYQRLQELDIKVKVVTRKAASNTPIGADFFHDLAETHHPVANHLRSIEGDFLNSFWKSAYQHEMGPERDAAWFIKTFCKEGTPSNIRPDEDIRPYLKGRVLYDAIALMAGVDGIAQDLFQPVLVNVQHTTHEVIGLSQQVTGLRDPQKLAALVTALAKDGLRPSP